MNEAREFSEHIIDRRYVRTGLKKKPRTYRHKARKAYLAMVKKKRPGAKLSVSLTGDGVARVDHLRWDAFHEGHDLPSQVEAYRQCHGAYPEVVLGDTIYANRDNRRYLKSAGYPSTVSPADTLLRQFTHSCIVETIVPIDLRQ